MDDIRLDHTELQAFTEQLFAAAGLRPEEAAVEAEILIWADLRGLASHGIFRAPMYLDWMARGLRNPASNPQVLHEQGAACLIDADRAPGLYMMKSAMSKAMDIARRTAVGWVVVRKVTHTGAMGYYVRHAAEAGFIGLATCASSPLMAVHGSRVPALGTSPLAIGVPRAGKAPVVLDMSSAAIPWGKLAQARARGAALPEGVALDARGRPTTDAGKAAVALPLAGPKGSGLGIMIECMTSLLGGFPLTAPALEDPGSMSRALNAAAIAVDPGAFGDPETFADEVDHMARALAALPTAEGHDEILMPGERGDREMAARKRDGIPVPAELWGRLTDIGRSLNVTPPPAMAA